jgi:hypothetical protein
MTLIKTTDEQILRVAEIVVAMRTAQLDTSFIAACARLAHTDRGAFELMDLWFDTSDDPAERDEILADLQEAIDDASLPRTPEERPYIKFDDLDNVASNVVEHKRRLREIIDRSGGINEVARRMGMPQPSLSRMLRSASMPRRTTLNRIAKALGLSEREIVGEWVR